MNKKAKKRIAVLRAKTQKLQQLLAAAKQQCDDPNEVPELEHQMSEVRQELEALNKLNGDR
ncbi:MAG: hypothetical protein WD851_07155 [Pirellulales bacterium]